MGKRSELLVGLDIGTSKVAVVVGDVVDGAVNIVGAGFAQTEDGLRKGVVVNIDATVNSIEHAVKEAEVTAGCEIHRVFADVGGAHVRGFNSHGAIALRRHEVSQADVDRVLEAARTVPLPADKNILHVLPQDFVLDSQDGIKVPVGMSGMRLESRVHIVTTSTPAAQNVVKCCQRSGLHVLDLVLEPLAAAEAVLSKEEKEMGVALVDLGAGTTDVLIFHRGALKHTAVLSVGGNHVSADVAAGLQTPFRDAEHLKIWSGCALSRLVPRDQTVEVPKVGGRAAHPAGRQFLAQVIESRLEEILVLAKRQIVKCGFDESLGSGVVLTGGTAMMEGLTTLAEQVFQSPVRLGTPATIHSEGHGVMATDTNTPRFAAAVGLLKYGLDPRDHVPARPEETRLFGRFRSRIRGIMESIFE